MSDRNLLFTSSLPKPLLDHAATPKLIANGWRRSADVKMNDNYVNINCCTSHAELSSSCLSFVLSSSSAKERYAWSAGPVITRLGTEKQLLPSSHGAMNMEVVDAPPWSDRWCVEKHQSHLLKICGELLKVLHGTYRGKQRHDVHSASEYACSGPSVIVFHRPDK